MPIQLQSGQMLSDADITNWLSSHSDPTELAAEAKRLGLNDAQIQQALQIGAANKAGMQAGGQWLGVNDIKSYLQNGGSVAQWAQQHGITDLDKIHTLGNQAQALAGSANPTGDAALQAAFKQYQQYSPNGKFANNYQGWVGDLNPNVRDAIKSGSYTGSLGATASADFAPGGVYYGVPISYQQAGQGPRGMGDSWGSAPAGSGSSTGTSVAGPTGRPWTPTGGPSGIGTGARQYAGGSGTFDESARFSPQHVDNNPWGADMWRTGAGNASNWAADLARLMQGRAANARQGVDYGSPNNAPQGVAADSIAQSLLLGGMPLGAGGQTSTWGAGDGQGSNLQPPPPGGMPLGAGGQTSTWGAGDGQGSNLQPPSGPGIGAGGPAPYDGPMFARGGRVGVGLMAARYATKVR